MSYANAVATLALFVALGGSAYAVKQLPKNSVGARQLKRNSVTKQKVRKNAIDGRRVKNNSLTGADIKLSRLGTVPSARTANSAQTATSAGTATNANHANSADAAPLPQTLSSGRSEKGVWTVTGAAPGANTVFSAALSFTVPLTSKPTAHFIPKGVPLPAGCSGNVAAPAAAPGNLCVFLTFKPINLTQVSFYDPETEEENATASGKTGALVVFESEGAGEVQALGTFAVTAG